MFKVIGSLSNVRPAKSNVAELSTTPTKGNIKLNSPAAEKMKVTIGDFIAIVKAEDENGVSLYAVKGNAADESKGVKQVGSILSGKSGGSLLLSSENAFRELGGNGGNKQVYTLEDAIVADGAEYFKLSFVRTEAKMERKLANA